MYENWFRHILNIRRHKPTEEEYVSSIIERRIKLIRQLMKQGWSRAVAVDCARYTYRF